QKVTKSAKVFRFFHLRVLRDLCVEFSEACTAKQPRIDEFGCGFAALVLKRLCPNIAAKLSAVEPNLLNRAIRVFPCSRQIRSPRGPSQNASATRDDLPVSAGRSGVKYFCSRQRSCLGETVDGLSFFISSGIARRSHDYAYRRLGTPFNCDTVQCPVD